MIERLQKLIAQSGICSRRHAEELILDGKVMVNGVIVNTLGSKASDEDEIIVNGKKLVLEKKVYYMLNKPKDTITTSSDTHDRNTVIDLFKDLKERVFAVGRLDKDTTGLLIITNDGDLSMKLMHPRFETDKTYECVVEPSLNQETLNILLKGVYLDDGYAKANSVKLIDYNSRLCKVSINISIGKKHIVKRMIKYVGGEVKELKRITMGPLKLDKTLKEGQYRMLTEEEIDKLKKM